jgi:hypothetical protein
MRMLNEILSANRIKEKRSVVAKFNPHFYLMFQDGVKRYEHQDDQETEVTSHIDSVRDGVEQTQERTK